MGTGRRLKDGSSGLRTAITVSALAATVIGWAVLAAGAPPEPGAVDVTAPDPAAADAPEPGPARATGDGPPMPSLVSIDTRPLPARPARPVRPDVRTRASRGLR